MQDLLMTPGSGELQVMEFMVDNKRYGINVLKLKGIVQLEDVVDMPHRPGEILGVSNIRDSITTIIDLHYVLTKVKAELAPKPLALLCEFNAVSVAFLVDSVEGIHRLRWENMGTDGNEDKNKITNGGFLIDGQILVMLDFESVVMGTGLGKSYIDADKYEAHIKVSAEKYILFAEDSMLIAEKIKAILSSAGYKNVRYFTNGKEAYDYLMMLKEERAEHFNEKANILITDIEMPIMDGYTLTKHVKDDPILKTLPVVFFSSLINDEIIHKGELVGADAQVCKPSAKELVEVVEGILARAK